jgi:hypothetical protein
MVIIEAFGARIRCSSKCTSQIGEFGTVCQMSRGRAFGRLSAVFELEIIRKDRWSQRLRRVEDALTNMLEIT